MKAKEKTKWVCDECGQDYSKWQGKCICGSWNTIREFHEKTIKVMNEKIKDKSRGPEHIKDVKKEDFTRFPTGIQELDRVLGGGLVKGSVVLLSGDPGQGKTTLLTQVANNIASSVGRVIYFSGEENKYQVKLRAERLGVNLEADLLLHYTEDITAIEVYIDELKPELIIVDSIQTTGDPEIPSRPGSIQQVVAATGKLRQIAKEKGVTTLVIGHVTKDGNVAGPKLLEHMVDAVLYLEGEASELKILRNIKNRFADKTEIGVFQMNNEGMQEVPNPSEFLLANRLHDESGSAIICVSEERPILLEIQALVVESKVENAITARTTDGFSRNRLNIIVAVLEKKCKERLFNQNIYVNAVGGMKVEEPGADLGVALAIYSSLHETTIPSGTVVVGEIGLTGEIRPVSRMEQILKEIQKLGFQRCVLPEKNYMKIKNKPKNLMLIPVQTVKEAIQKTFFEKNEN